MARRTHRRRKEGGKRKMSDWNRFTKKVYEELKRKNKNVTFKAALKEASRRRKKD